MQCFTMWLFVVSFLGLEIELFRVICRGLGYGILYLLGTTLTTLGTTYMVPLT